MTGADAGLAPAADGFRSDINGLRAISIALVVAYHLTRRWAPGGFIGVDVFFVISGFLMTGIILGRLREGRFRVGDFYVARLRRIWPALVALCAALLLVGAVALDPWTFERLAADVPSALLFFSNVVFAGRRGYFNAGELDNWLLHTWSLSVEWQFYLLYPLALLVIFAVPALRRRVWWVLGALAAGSFALSLVLSARENGWSFYLLPTRAWELLAGAFCAAPLPVALGAGTRVALHAVGLALIGIGASLSPPTDNWPSALTLLPVSGAAMVIAADVGRAVWAQNPVVDLTGRASYSIYLWHWPLIVAMRYAGVVTTPLVALGLAAATGAIGLASYWLIEQRATRWVFGKAETRATGLVAAVATIAFAVTAWQTRGLQTVKVPDPAERAVLDDARAADRDWAYPSACGRIERTQGLTLCRMGDPATRRVLVIGDSHAEMIAPRYAHAFDAGPGQGATFLTEGGCLPIPGVGNVLPRRERCARWSSAAFAWAERSGFRRVVVVAAWPAYFEPVASAPLGDACLAEAGACASRWSGSLVGLADAVFARLRDTVARLQRRGIEVVVIGPTPAGPDLQRLYRQAYWRGDLSSPAQSRAEIEAQMSLVRGHLGAVHASTGAPLVDPLDALCPQGLCPTADAGHLLYKDRTHFRATAMAGARFGYLDPWIAPAPASASAK